MRDTALPNLNPGHTDRCTMTLVYADPDAPPTLVVVRCAEGCPHTMLVLEEGD